MSKSVFSKNSFKLFGILSLFSLVAGAIPASILGVTIGYVTDQKETMDNLYLGSSFGVDEVIDKYNGKPQWIKDSNFTCLTNVNGELVNSEEVVSYDEATSRFIVNGVGEGEINFISNFDKTIQLKVGFKTNFNEEGMMNIINEQYSQFASDGVISKTELQEVKQVILPSYKSTFDFNDFKSLTKLEKMYIPYYSASKYLEASNFDKVDEGVDLYVPYQHFETYFKGGVKNIPTRENMFAYDFNDENFDSKISIIVHKNGGKLHSNDNQLYCCFFLEKGDKLNDTDYSYIENLTNEGHHFSSLKVDGEVVDKNTEFNVSSHINVEWLLNSYVVVFNFNSIDLPVVLNDSINSTYSYNESFNLPELNLIKNLVSNTNVSECEFLGWSKNKYATKAEYTPGQTVSNLSLTHGEVINLFAIWRYKTINVEYHYYASNGIDEISTILSYTYDSQTKIVIGDSIHPEYYKGSFVGWARSKDAQTVEFTPGLEVDMFVCMSTNENANKIHLYAIYRPDFYTVEFLDKNDNVYYSISNIPLESDVKLPDYSAESQYAKEGKQYVGWMDNSSKTLYCFSRYRDLLDISDIQINELVYLNDSNIVEGGFLVNSETGKVVLTPYFINNVFSFSFCSHTNTYTSLFNVAATYDSDVYISIENVRKLSITGYTLSNYSINYEGQIYNLEKLTTGEYKMPKESVNKIYNRYIGDENLLTNNTVPLDPSQTVISDLTFEYEVNEYTVTFVYDDNNKENYTVIYNQEFTINGLTGKSQPSKKNKEFKGWLWSHDKEVYDHKDSITYSLTYDTTFTAQWENGCVLGNAQIATKDSIKNAEDVTIGDELQTWDFETGEVVTRPIAFIEQNPVKASDVITFYFTSGRTTSFVDAHSFFNITKEEFVGITRLNYKEFIDDEFAFINQNGNVVKDKVIYAEWVVEEVASYEFISAINYNIVVDGYISSAEPVNDILNTFTFDINQMTYDMDLMRKDIQIYGLSEYDEFAYLVTYEQFIAFNAKYIGLGIRKGCYSLEYIEELVKLYLK